MATTHYKTDSNLSICMATASTDVFSYGGDTGPTDYCTSCRAAEPHWDHVTDDEYYRIENTIY